MASPRVFAARMKRLAQDIEKNCDATVRKCALAVDATVVLATPVDTGRARANWQVELNGPHTTADENKFSPSGQESIDAAKAVISTYNGARDTSIHITNNLSYIGRLNEGWSKQAPAGFVEKAVMVGVQAIRNAKVVRTVS